MLGLRLVVIYNSLFVLQKPCKFSSPVENPSWGTREATGLVLEDY